jgi:Flp pilus assembly protein TadD
VLFRSAERPDFPEAHRGLALALLATGRPREAVGHLQEALRLRPDLPGARDDLQRAQRFAGARGAQ